MIKTLLKSTLIFSFLVYASACGKKNSAPSKVKPEGSPVKNEVIEGRTSSPSSPRGSGGSTTGVTSDSKDEGESSGEGLIRADEGQTPIEGRTAADEALESVPYVKKEPEDKVVLGPQHSGQAPAYISSQATYYASYRDVDGVLGTQELNNIRRLQQSGRLEPTDLVANGSVLMELNEKNEIIAKYATDKHKNQIGISLKILYDLHRKGLCDLSMTRGCVIVEGNEVYLVGRIPKGDCSNEKIVGYPLSFVNDSSVVIEQLVQIKNSCPGIDAVVYYQRPQVATHPSTSTPDQPKSENNYNCVFEGRIQSKTTRFILSYERGEGEGVIVCTDKEGRTQRQEVKLELSGWGLGLSLGAEVKTVDCPAGSASDDVCYDLPAPKLTQYQNIKFSGQELYPEKGIEDLIGKFVFLDAGVDVCKASPQLKTLPTVYIGKTRYKNSEEFDFSTYSRPVESYNRFPVNVQVESTDDICALGAGIGGASLRISKK
ncbi:MAG: hypothetical protein KDD50_01105 [Bdellovibrionales bacterium]|nr:hypothetical protein [Bdellovibrionales bacterium]